MVTCEFCAEVMSPDPIWAVWTKFCGVPIMDLSILRRVLCETKKKEATHLFPCQNCHQNINILQKTKIPTKTYDITKEVNLTEQLAIVTSERQRKVLICLFNLSQNMEVEHKDQENLMN